MEPAKALLDWKVIAEAGGMHAWVLAELRRRDLLDEGVDTSKLSRAERNRYKARREEERRVRRLLHKEAWAAYRRAHIVHVGVGIFYHDTADIDRFDIDELEARRETNQLPKLPDAQALAESLELSVSRLRQLVYVRNVDGGSHYHRWLIPKRSGGSRLISAPKPDLKKAQRWVARHISEHLPVHGSAHGFLPGRSTVTNAAPHAGASVIVKLDIQDFYPTVSYRRVRGMFRKAGYREQVATLLALLCTESPREQMVIDGKTSFVTVGERSLPQGAPTSPSLSNAICLRMDARLAGLAQRLGVRYTRYADDMTFSWHGKRNKAPISALLGSVRRIVEGEGFAIKPEKTRIMRSGRRQQVTGLVVNGKQHPQRARVPRKMRRLLRAAIKNRELGREGGGESLEQLRGLAAYIHMTNPQQGKALLARIDALMPKDTAAQTGQPASSATADAGTTEAEAATSKTDSED